MKAWLVPAAGSRIAGVVDLFLSFETQHEPLYTNEFLSGLHAD